MYPFEWIFIFVQAIIDINSCERVIVTEHESYAGKLLGSVMADVSSFGCDEIGPCGGIGSGSVT